MKPARLRLAGLAIFLVFGVAACGGSGATTAPTSRPSPATSSTTARHAPSFVDVFDATPPEGYVLADAPPDTRATVRHVLETPEGASVLRDVDLKAIRSAGTTVGVVTVFLLKPNQPQFSLVRGYADSRPNSILTSATVADKRVTLIQWSGTGRVAYADSTSEILIIVEMQNRAELDAVTPSLMSPI